MQDTGGRKQDPIRSFRDLRVYQNLYRAMLMVLQEIVPKLPKEEKYDLQDQIRRACKAAPALIAEGFAKRYQRRNWQKYIDDTVGECNEMIHHLSVCIDVYGNQINARRCEEAVAIYDGACGQLYNLKKAWKDFHKND